MLSNKDLLIAIKYNHDNTEWLSDAQILSYWQELKQAENKGEVYDNLPFSLSTSLNPDLDPEEVIVQTENLARLFDEARQTPALVAVDGIVYESKPSPNGECHGCDGNLDRGYGRTICHRLPDCSYIIWVKVEE